VQIGEKLGKRLKKSGVTLPSDAVTSLISYFELLRKWNQKVSLTALPVAGDGDEALDRLLIEPVLAARNLPSASAAVLDVGSGGGSPAIPMKIASPAISLRMVESKTRKAAFLREAIRHLDLAETAVEASRVEQLLIRPELHESFDVVTLRAVRVERKLLQAVEGFLKPGGMLFLFRSGSTEGDALLATDSLHVEASHMLLPHLQSRLVVLRNVPRGTIAGNQR
jgi:16S rRNA (guanine527-N7)-methyltransferase